MGLLVVPAGIVEFPGFWLSLWHKCLGSLLCSFALPFKLPPQSERGKTSRRDSSPLKWGGNPCQEPWLAALISRPLSEHPQSHFEVVRTLKIELSPPRELNFQKVTEFAK